MVANLDIRPGPPSSIWWWPLKHVRYASEWYSSYWNAFLFFPRNLGAFYSDFEHRWILAFFYLIIVFLHVCLRSSAHSSHFHNSSECGIIRFSKRFAICMLDALSAITMTGNNRKIKQCNKFWEIQAILFIYNSVEYDSVTYVQLLWHKSYHVSSASDSLSWWHDSCNHFNVLMAWFLQSL